MTRSLKQKDETAIEPRKRPRQERSAEMVERILGSAQRLVKAQGAKGLTTIAIAEQAGLSVGSLYQYYPNKEAIILDLARRWLSAFPAQIEARHHASPPQNQDEFQHEIRAFVRSVAKIYLDNADLLPILDAMHLDRELRRIMAAHDTTIIEAHANWFKGINPALGDDTARRLGLVMLEMGHACLLAAVRQDHATFELMLEDLDAMHLALLRPHLGLFTDARS